MCVRGYEDEDEGHGGRRGGGEVPGSTKKEKWGEGSKMNEKYYKRNETCVQKGPENKERGPRHDPSAHVFFYFHFSSKIPGER